MTLEYVDVDGGFHGAIFELKKGQGEAFRNELVAKGVRVSDSEDEPTKQTEGYLKSEKVTQAHRWFWPRS